MPNTPGKRRRRTGGATVRDVARRAYVSPMTVSRVVNGVQYVRPEVRERVLKVVRELNYIPNVAARSLSVERRMRIALIGTSPRAAYWRELLIGTLDAAARISAQIVLDTWDLSTPACTRASARHTAQSVGSVILPPPLCESKVVCSTLATSGVSVVAIAPGRVHPAFSSVHIDDYAASLQMTQHLIDAGHSRIALIKGNPNLSASELRYEGFLAAMAKAGLRVDPALIQQGDFTYRSGLEAAERLLNLQHPPTAIFASNDDMAAATVSVAHRRALEVPADLSVVGFDDTTTATTIWPELTTIRQPIASMAGIAITLLSRNIREKDRGRTATLVDHVVKHELIQRHSVAPPRACALHRRRACR